MLILGTQEIQAQARRVLHKYSTGEILPELRPEAQAHDDNSPPESRINGRDKKRVVSSRFVWLSQSARWRDVGVSCDKFDADVTTAVGGKE